MWAPTQEQRPWGGGCSDKQNMVVERQASGVRMLGLKPSCVTLGQLLNSSGPQSSHL